MNQNHSNVSTTQEFTPEEIAQLKKLIGFSKSITDSLNTGAIVSLAQTANSLGSMLNDINTPEMQKLLTALSNTSVELATTMTKLKTMINDGTLDHLLEMATFIVALKKSFSTDIIIKLTKMLPDAKTLSMMENAFDALEQTQDEIKKNPPNVGVFSLLGVLKDPDIQYLLGFLIQFSKKFSKLTRE